MSNAQGGDDSLTVTNSGAGSYSYLYGDAGDYWDSTGYMIGGTGGDDTLNATNSGAGSFSFLYGDAVQMYVHAHGGNDHLTAENDGSESHSVLYGDADILSSSTGGDDVLTVNGGSVDSFHTSYLYGDAITMEGTAAGGNDTLFGSDGNDELYGDAQFYPSTATGGTDTLNGGAGNDELWGGPNNDTFVFNLGSGYDKINDFNQGNQGLTAYEGVTEHDVIDIRDYGFASWDALSAAMSSPLGSTNTVIDLTPGIDDFNSITLVNVLPSALHENDFIIA
jgi:Ca2+-binding RTX toxin-like protein